MLILAYHYAARSPAARAFFGPRTPAVYQAVNYDGN